MERLEVPQFLGLLVLLFAASEDMRQPRSKNRPARSPWRTASRRYLGRVRAWRPQRPQ